MAQAFIVRRGGGGSTKLNFTVVASTTQPTNPKENTVWVNTSATITSWQWMAAQPNVPAEGMLWVCVSDQTSTLEFNALLDGTNSLYAYPSGAKLYTGGDWVVVEAFIYQNSSWVQFQSLFGLDSFSFSNPSSIEKIDDGNGDWRIKINASGTLTCGGNGLMDVFLVGGGGGSGNLNSWTCGGGGGGYTKTENNVPVESGTYEVVVGSGGTGNAGGGTSSAFSFSALGGASTNGGTKGGAGGSGGGGGGAVGAGGVDGGNGTSNGDWTGGRGQGTTTREFADAAGALYATGGSGTENGYADGAQNTGDGGGGTRNTNRLTTGGSGIVIIRNARGAA